MLITHDVPTFCPLPVSELKAYDYCRELISTVDGRFLSTAESTRTYNLNTHQVTAKLFAGELYVITGRLPHPHRSLSPDVQPRLPGFC